MNLFFKLRSILILNRNWFTLTRVLVKNNFFKQAERGIHISGKTRNVVALKLQNLLQKKGLDKIVSLLEILSGIDIHGTGHKII